MSNKSITQGDQRWSERKGQLVKVTLGLVALVLAAVIGFMSGAMRSGASGTLALQQRVPFDVFWNQQSFSEVENTMAKLEALSAEFLTEVRLRHDISASTWPASQPAGGRSYSVDPAHAIGEIQKGIEGFKGTEQELLLSRELLSLLKRQHLDERWLNVYLAILYAHPMDPLVASAAADAVMISTQIGRGDELARAFAFLNFIPLEFPGKERISTISEGLRFTEIFSAELETVARRQPPDPGEELWQ